jgi:hypothetical protein
MKLGRSPYVIGCAGLLPAVAALGVFLAGPPQMRPFAWQAGILYATLILSFLGGTWWSFALRATPARRPLLLALAALPTALAFVLVMVMAPIWAVLLGALLIAILPIDALFERLGLAPPGWTGLRALLSAGLGLVTVALAIAGLRAL